MGRCKPAPKKNSVTRQLNDHHLRVVSVDDTAEPTQPQFVTDWSKLCDSFTTATGMPLTFRAADEEAPVAPVAWSTEVPAVGPYAPGTLSLLQKKTRLGQERVAAIESLAHQVGDLVQQLHEAQRALWQREAELMTAIPLVVRPDKEPNQLAARFESILKCGAEALHCHAAAIYILDDDTRHLKMRAHFGLKHSRLTAPPRPLKTARADVEALAGYAVTLSDSEELQSWNVPEDFESAICVPISTANVPLGTLWIFSKETQTFSDEQVNVAEIIGSRIAVECEREILLREQGVVGGAGPRMDEAIAQQKESLPEAASGIDDWQIAARPTTRSRLHGDFYNWHIGLDNQAHLTLTTAYEQGIPAALTAATISGLVQQQSLNEFADDTNLTPVSRIEDIHHSLLSTSTGDRHAAVACASLAEKNGSTQIAVAGQADAFIIRPHSWEHLAKAAAMPAGILSEGDLPQPFDAKLEGGDLLLLISGRPCCQPRIHAEEQVRQIDAAHYAEALLHYMHLPVEEMTTVLASLWEPGKSVWETPPAVMIARRRD